MEFQIQALVAREVLKVTDAQLRRVVAEEVAKALGNPTPKSVRQLPKEAEPKVNMDLTALLSSVSSEMRKLFVEFLDVKIPVDDKKPVQRKIPESPDGEKMLTCNDVVSLLRISRVTLDKHVKNHVIPSYRIGKRILFKESEVKAAMLPTRTVMDYETAKQVEAVFSC